MAKPSLLSPQGKKGARQETFVVKRLAPSQAGAIKLARRYGDALICVRYRRSADGTHRYTTVELVVDDAPARHRALADSETVLIRLEFDNAACRREALLHGARWNARRKLWSMPCATARALGWLDRIVKR